MKKLFFALLLVVAILFFGCIEIEDSDGPEPPGGNPPDQNAPPADQNIPLTQDELTLRINECKAKISTTEVDTCIQNLAVSEKKSVVCRQLQRFSEDFCINEVAKVSLLESDCDLVQADFLKNDCFFNVAKLSLKIPTCDLITGNVDLRNECKEFIILNGPPLPCEKLAALEQKDLCYTETAVSSGNPLLCKFVSKTLVEKKYERDKCVEQILTVFNSPNACKVFVDVNKMENCSFESAKELFDDEPCNNVGQFYDKDECFDFVARNRPDHLVCAKISDAQVSKDCVNIIAETYPTEELCNLATEFASKDKCNLKLATDSNSFFYCEKISHGDIKSDCFYQVAIASNNIESCKLITHTAFDLKDDCYSRIAVEKLDDPICENVHFFDNYISCFSDIAIALNDISICDKMLVFQFIDIDYHPRYGCYIDFAVDNGLESICETITPTTPRTECFDAFDTNSP